MRPAALQPDLSSEGALALHAGTPALHHSRRATGRPSVNPAIDTASPSDVPRGSAPPVDRGGGRGPRRDLQQRWPTGHPDCLREKGIGREDRGWGAAGLIRPALLGEGAPLATTG